MLDTDELVSMINSMQSDVTSLRYTRQEIKDKHKNLFDKSMHLFDLIIANKLDTDVLDAMIKQLKKRQDQNEAINDGIDRDMGKLLANKFLYPTIGVQRELTKEEEDILIRKIQKENEKSKEETIKLNSGGTTNAQRIKLSL